MDMATQTRKRTRKLTQSLTIRDVPTDIVARLKARAKRNRRSLHGEVLTILEESAGPQKLTVQEVYERAQRLNLRGDSNSTQIIREMRDAR